MDRKPGRVRNSPDVDKSLWSRKERCVRCGQVFVVGGASMCTDWKGGKRPHILPGQKIPGLDLSIRARNILWDGFQARSIDDVSAILGSQLVAQRQCGGKTLKEIRLALARAGKCLKSDMTDFDEQSDKDLVDACLRFAENRWIELPVGLVFLLRTVAKRLGGRDGSQNG